MMSEEKAEAAGAARKEGQGMWPFRYGESREYCDGLGAAQLGST